VFITFPSYPRYRALKLQEPHITGEDVYALQSALKPFHDPGPLDGVLGKQTDAAIGKAQAELGIAVDSVAGPGTWRALVDAIAKPARDKHGIAVGLLYGQLAHESGLYGGNYSPKRSDGSYDAGVAQRNTSFTKPEEGFHVALSIEALAQWVKRYYDDFSGLPKRRRWGLAAGAWNAPAFACYIANEEGASVPRNRTAKPSDSARKTFEAYIQSVTAYLRV
jgi:hypothetical protein